MASSLSLIAPVRLVVQEAIVALVDGTNTRTARY